STVHAISYHLSLHAALPILWRLAGGANRSVPLYDTEGGWLQLSTEELVEGAIAAKRQGWPGVKLKVGKPRPGEDFERLNAVRERSEEHTSELQSRVDVVCRL